MQEISRSHSPGASVTMDREGSVATIRLNRPEVGNAINVDLARALHDAAVACDLDADVRCVVLTGTGKLFCAGGDIGLFASAGDRIGNILLELTGWLHPAISRLARMNKPLVTGINGAAAGAGLGLAILGDIAIAARSASFTMAYPGIGLSPDAGSTWLLPRLVGLRRAQDLAIGNRRVGATEAADIGLVTRVVDDGDLESECQAVAARLAQGAVRATGRTRQLLLSSFGQSLEDHLAAEARQISDAGMDRDAAEGIAAFIGRRPPVFLPPE